MIYCWQTVLSSSRFNLSMSVLDFLFPCIIGLKDRILYLKQLHISRLKLRYFEAHFGRWFYTNFRLLHFIIRSIKHFKEFSSSNVWKNVIIIMWLFNVTFGQLKHIQSPNQQELQNFYLSYCKFSNIKGIVRIWQISITAKAYDTMKTL